MYGKKTTRLSPKNTILALLVILGVLFSIISSSYAAQLADRSLKLSRSTPAAASVVYSLTFTNPANNIIGSVELELCSNDPFPGLPCNPPAGLNFTASNITSQSGIAGLSKHPNSTANKIIFTKAPGLVANGVINITIDNVANPNSVGTYFARIRTFASIDATGIATDAGGLAFAINSDISTSTEVPQFLYICVAVNIPGYLCNDATGDFVDMGELSSSNAKTETSQFVIAANADNGFNVSINGTTMTSGNNIIPALAVQTASNPGTSQFGINLKQNFNPPIGQDPVGLGGSVPTAEYNTPNLFRFVSGDAIVSSNTTSNYRKFTVSYVINIDSNQKPGIYNTTLLFVILASF